LDDSGIRSGAFNSCSMLEVSTLLSRLMASSAEPRVVCFEIWKTLPLAAEPPPNWSRATFPT